MIYKRERWLPCDLGARAATTTVFEFNFKKLAFGISAWDAGCGLESIGG